MQNTNRQIISISTDIDTRQRLKQYAKENHKTVSQAITDWIWSVKLKSETNNKSRPIK